MIAGNLIGQLRLPASSGIKGNELSAGADVDDFTFLGGAGVLTTATADSIYYIDIN